MRMSEMRLGMFNGNLYVLDTFVMERQRQLDRAHGRLWIEGMMFESERALRRPRIRSSVGDWLVRVGEWVGAERPCEATA